MVRMTLCLLLILYAGFLQAAQKDKEEKPEEPLPEAWSKSSEHEVRIGDRTIRYTATAGALLMKDDEDQPHALFGYTSYVADDEDKGNRPIMFAYNGGPGSASIWLHMGVLGPQRAVVTDAGFGPAGPFRRVGNAYSILDEADLVMMDPVGTGFSKPVGEGETKDFWGVDQDIKSVSEFIVRYVTDSGRWASPKYVLGESYGGMRTGGVSYFLLTKHNMALNGVILVSPFMEMATGFAGLGIDLPHVMFLPTFAATAWYHDVLTVKPGSLQTLMDEVRDFAVNEYAPALLAGERLSAERSREVLAGLSRYTGISEDYWDKANLRIDEGRFTQELMREHGITVGRVDSRFAGDSINKLAENAPYDPFMSAVGPSYLAAFMDYYRRDLGVEKSEEYVVSGGFFMQWDWKHVQPDLGGFALPFPNTAVDLEYAMKQNPSMHVLVQQGYFDLATPHFASEYVIEHMDLTAKQRERIDFEYYEAGHMMYVHEPSLIEFKEDLARFVQESH